MCYFMDIKWNGIWEINKYYYNIIKSDKINLQKFLDKNWFVHLAGRCDWDLVKKDF